MHTDWAGYIGWLRANAAMQEPSNVPAEILLTAQVALLGEIFPSLEAVDISANASSIHFKFILSAPPTDDDMDSMTSIEAEMDASFYPERLTTSEFFVGSKNDTERGTRCLFSRRPDYSPQTTQQPVELKRALLVLHLGLVEIRNIALGAGSEQIALLADALEIVPTECLQEDSGARLAGYMANYEKRYPRGGWPFSEILEGTLYWDQTADQRISEILR